MAQRPIDEILEDAFIRCRDLQAPLADRLQAFADEVRRLGPHFAEAVDALVNRLVEAGAGSTPPPVGETMPQYLLHHAHGTHVRLNYLAAAGPRGLSYHRGETVPYC